MIQNLQNLVKKSNENAKLTKMFCFDCIIKTLNTGKIKKYSW